jgi:hypothetical protein
MRALLERLDFMRSAVSRPGRGHSGPAGRTDMMNLRSRAARKPPARVIKKSAQHSGQADLLVRDRCAEQREDPVPGRLHHVVIVAAHGLDHDAELRVDGMSLNRASKRGIFG